MNNIAIIDKNTKCSYIQLYKYIQKTIAFLKDLKIKENDKIILFDDNSIEVVILIFALNKIGAIFTILNTRTNNKKFQYIFNDIKSSTIFISHNYYKEKKELIKQNFISIFINDNLLENIQKYNIKTDKIEKTFFQFPNNDKIATIIYTSGSTGFPKGVIVLNKNINFSMKEIQKRLEYQSNDKILCGLDFSFDYGLYQIFLTFNVGATLIIKENYNNLLDVPTLLYKYQITIFPVVPTIIDTLLISRLLERVKLNSLRMITSTGDVLTISTIKKIKKILPNVLIIPMYGITECKRVAIMPKDMLEKKIGSVGKVLDNVKIYLKSNGELVVEGENVTAGYLNDKNSSNQSTYFEIKNNKKILHTGDYFKIDNDGYLYFIGRKDDLVKINSKRISLKEIERDLKDTFLTINEISIIFREKLFIFIYGEIDKNKISKFIKTNFFIDRIEVYIIKKSLPKNNNGKIDKNELFKQYLSW